jgi:uncharacterized protein
MNKLMSLAKKSPLLFYLTVIFIISWVSLLPLLLFKLPLEPGLLVLTYVGLLGVAIYISYKEHGKAGIMSLFSKTFRWKINPVYYAFAVFVIPLTTLIIGIFTGSTSLTQNWSATFTTFILTTLSNFLIINLWEETGWAGFFQTRLAVKHGIFRAALITAPAFAAIHIPIMIQQSTNNDLLQNMIIIFLFAFFFRYLIGMQLKDTDNSVFLAGLLHASFNSSNDFGVPEVILATCIITVLVYIFRRKNIFKY